MFSQRFVAPRAQLVSLGQTEAELNQKSYVQAPPNLRPIKADMQAAGDQLNTMLTQQAGQLEQAQETASNLWWSMNWPLVAGGAALLGLVGFLVFKKS